MRSMVEGASSIEASLAAVAPSTALRAVPLPHFRGGGCGSARARADISGGGEHEERDKAGADGEP